MFPRFLYLLVAIIVGGALYYLIKFFEKKTGVKIGEDEAPKLVMKKYFLYNEQEQIIEEGEYNFYKEIIGKTISQYNEEGYLVSNKTYDKNNLLISENTFDPNEKISITLSDLIDKDAFIVKEQKDERGLIVEERFYDKNGEYDFPLIGLTHEYSEKGNRTKTTLFELKA